MWLLVLQAALLALIACSVGAAVVIYIGRSRRERSRQEPDPYLDSTSQLGGAHWTDAEADPESPGGSEPPEDEVR